MFDDILRYYIPEPNTGCFLWYGATTSWGYGQIKINGRQIGAHHLSWLVAHGELDTKKVLCHRCDTPACINPAHLFLATQAENVRDMHRKRRGRNSKKTECSRGHVFDIRNTYVTKKTTRRCRVCARLRDTRRRYAKKTKEFLQFKAKENESGGQKGGKETGIQAQGLMN